RRRAAADSTQSVPPVFVPHCERGSCRDGRRKRARSRATTRRSEHKAAVHSPQWHLGETWKSSRSCPPRRAQKRSPVEDKWQAARRCCNERRGPPHIRRRGRPAQPRDRNGKGRGACREQPRPPGTSRSTGSFILPASRVEKAGTDAASTVACRASRCPISKCG